MELNGFKITDHALGEIAKRRIPLEIVGEVLLSPEQIVPERRGRNCYQSRIVFPSGGTYLVRRPGQQLLHRQPSLAASLAVRGSDLGEPRAPRRRVGRPQAPRTTTRERASSARSTAPTSGGRPASRRPRTSRTTSSLGFSLAARRISAIAPLWLPSSASAIASSRCEYQFRELRRSARSK